MKYKVNLLILSLVCIIAYIANNFFTFPLALSYVILVLFVAIFFLLPYKFALYNVFFLIPFISLFDKIGFTYTFNACLIISFIKEILFGQNVKIKKKQLLPIILIFLLELLLSVFYRKIDYNFVSFISLIISYIYLSIVCNRNENISFITIFKSLFWGIVISSFCCFAYNLIFYGYFVSNYIRFTALFRDPNYYSFFILLLMFSSYSIEKNDKIVFNYYFLILLIMGLLSVSKMFLFSVLIGFFIKFFHTMVSRKKKIKIKKKDILIAMILFVIFIICIYYVNHTGIFEHIYNSYLNRFRYQDLTTGRFELSSMYIKALLSNPWFLLFGASNTYYNYVIIEYMRNLGYYLPYYSTAHNTYLDILLSWGITGLLILFAFLKSVFIVNKKSLISHDFFAFIIIILFCFLSLSFLSADVFSLVVLYTICLLNFDWRQV